MRCVPAYSLRPACDSEYETLFALHREAMGGYVRETWGVWDDVVQRRFFDARMTGGRLQVITVEGDVAGLLELEQRQHDLFIVNLELGRRFQRRGIGSDIIRAAMTQSRLRGLPLELTVLRVNPARALYERLGFVEHGRTTTHHYMRWLPARAGNGGTPP